MGQIERPSWNYPFFDSSWIIYYLYPASQLQWALNNEGTLMEMWFLQEVKYISKVAKTNTRSVTILWFEKKKKMMDSEFGCWVFPSTFQETAEQYLRLFCCVILYEIFKKHVKCWGCFLPVCWGNDSRPLVVAFLPHTEVAWILHFCTDVSGYIAVIKSIF